MLRVLVVEDEQDTATTCAMLLRLYGCDVQVSADGPSALLAVEANPPDVVLLDLAMPKTDGWHLAQQIRLLRLGKRPLLIAVSGYGDKESRLQSYKAGIDLHLVKPVDPAELENLLKRFRKIIAADERYSEAVAKIRAYVATGIASFYQQGIDRLADLGVNVSRVREATRENARLLVEMYGSSVAD
jgi:CheY-like chemotaxis protein